jgi:ABC-type multidrug transport system ATPase subunit/ABC-type multidrug transport system permease subunit
MLLSFVNFSEIAVLGEAKFIA